MEIEKEKLLDELKGDGEKTDCPIAIRDGIGRDDSPFKMSSKIEWQRDPIIKEHTFCSYCGSLNPHEFMGLLRNGEGTIAPTDKSYKAYITDKNNDKVRFYFDHLQNKERKEFIELLNAGKIKIEDPGYFYVTPFFIKRK